MGKSNQIQMSYIPGPCNTFIAGEISPTGFTWKELAERRHNMILATFQRWGIDNPSLEMMYSKGIRYIKTKAKSIDGQNQIDIEFYHPKPHPKSITGAEYGRVYNVKQSGDFISFDNIEEDGNSEI